MCYPVVQPRIKTETETNVTDNWRDLSSQLCVNIQGTVAYISPTMMLLPDLSEFTFSSALSTNKCTPQTLNIVLFWSMEVPNRSCFTLNIGYIIAIKVFLTISSLFHCKRLDKSWISNSLINKLNHIHFYYLLNVTMNL